MKPALHNYFIILITSVLIGHPSYAASLSSLFDSNNQRILEDYYQKNKEKEYFSGAELSIYVPGNPIKNFYIGRVSHDPKSDKVTSNTLFEIGSITKSFTAAIILQLEKEGLLTLDNTIERWLPEYSKWSSLNITQLLNMTSGLPNYSDTPLWNVEESKQKSRVWTPRELIDFVYPPKFNPPLKSGYFYSNTGYTLSELIIEKATKHRFQDEIYRRAIKRADLHNTFYPVPTVDKQIRVRLAHGYNYNQYDNPTIVGQDMYENNVSWAGSAGGIIANSEDVIKWVKALFVGNAVLDAKQKNKLMTLVSTETGKPIEKTTSKNPSGFGLGVIQAHNKNSKLGRYWFYEGKTLGYRAIYMYEPCNGVIISAIFNSATNNENDNAGKLMQDVYLSLIKSTPGLSCKAN